jgi:hypothetical protein
MHFEQPPKRVTVNGIGKIANVDKPCHFTPSILAIHCACRRDQLRRISSDVC